MLYASKYEHLNKLAAYRDTLYTAPKLRFLFLELTDSCNLQCLHCGSNASPKNHTYLPFESIKRLLDRVANAYCPSDIMICLTGGEPLLHPDFYNIAAYSVKLGFSCGITTNGTLISSEVAVKIKQSGICSVGFSLDGLSQSHNWFRNKSSAFEETLSGIKNLKDIASSNITTQVTTVFHKRNLSELQALYDTVSDLEVDSWRLINLEPIGRALAHRDLLLNKEDMRYLLDYIYKKRREPSVTMEVTYGCSHYLPIQYEREVRDYYFICGSGIYVASVLCNGDIYSCLDIERRPELIQGNILVDDFVDVWEKRFQQFRKDRTLESKQCINCTHKRWCRGDSAHTWDYDLQQPLLCLQKLLEHECEINSCQYDERKKMTK